MSESIRHILDAANVGAMGTKITKAVIPAAGLGTRFLPATKAMPKEMLPVVDKPAIQYVVEEAVAAGLRDVLMITGRNKNALENYFDRMAELEAVLEREGDEPRLASGEEKMLDEQGKRNTSVIALMEVDPSQIHLYGAAAIEATDDPDVVRVTGLVEK